MADIRICSIEGCGKPACNVRGWCGAHYTRWRKHGDPTKGRTADGEPLRFYREVVLAYEGDDCLIWPYAKDATGYGKIRLDGKVHLVSRVVCDAVNGPPPTPEHEAAHGCGKGHEGCCAKRHLSWKTSAGNKADMLVHGTALRGERVHLAKLTESEARQIMSARGKISQSKLADIFGVSRSCIAHIHQGNSWAWV